MMLKSREIIDSRRRQGCNTSLDTPDVHGGAGPVTEGAAGVLAETEEQRSAAVGRQLEAAERAYEDAKVQFAQGLQDLLRHSF